MNENEHFEYWYQNGKGWGVVVNCMWHQFHPGTSLWPPLVGRQLNKEWGCGIYYEMKINRICWIEFYTVVFFFMISYHVLIYPFLSALRTAKSLQIAASASLLLLRPAHWGSTCAGVVAASPATSSFPRCHGVRENGRGRRMRRSWPGQHLCRSEPLLG